MNNWTNPYLWHRYTKRMTDKIERLHAAGHFSFSDAAQRGVHFAEGREGLAVDGNEILLTWLVDPLDGMIVDAKFQAFGHSALLIAAQAACELLVGKNYDQAKRLSAELIDKHVRDHVDEEAFPEETRPHLNLVIAAIEAACEQCLGLPLPATYATPLPREVSGEAGYPGWQELSKEEKIQVLEKVLDEEVRPYVEMDAGGVEILDLNEKSELLIAYQGACTSCFSSIGTTLNSIQQIIQTKIDSTIKVVPHLDDLKFL